MPAFDAGCGTNSLIPKSDNDGIGRLLKMGGCRADGLDHPLFETFGGG